MLNKEQIEVIKKQIISQIDSWKASDEQKKEAKEQIEEMPPEKLEEFLVKNKLIKEGDEESENEEQCVFCLISDGKIPAHKISESDKALAVLELNPISRGHTLIIPKKHERTGKFPDEIIEFAKKIASKLGDTLKPKEVKIANSELFGHAILNIIPVYGDEKELKERKKADEKELKELEEKLKEKKEHRIEEKKPEIFQSTKSEGKLAKKTEEVVRLEQPKKLEKVPRRVP